MLFKKTVKTNSKEELLDITSLAQTCLSSSKISDGICTIFIPHTTAGVTINENADPCVKADIIKGLKLVPEKGYSHLEGNSPAHIKASLIGPSLSIIIQGGQLLLGTWQGIYLAEFDGPRQREVVIKLSK